MPDFGLGSLREAQTPGEPLQVVFGAKPQTPNGTSGIPAALRGAFFMGLYQADWTKTADKRLSFLRQTTVRMEYHRVFITNSVCLRETPCSSVVNLLFSNRSYMVV
jgi:hypothetical protein